VTRVFSLLFLLTVAGCASYHAQPLVTADAAAHYNERRLDAPALRAALDSFGVHPSTGGWSDWDLAAAAWVLRPERARLAAEVRAAEAARITAGAREQPGLNTAAEYSFSGTHGESRWGLALSGVFTVELGGKRGARIGRANAGVLAAVARSEEEAWEVRWRVHEAAMRWAISDQVVSASAGERGQSDSLLVLLRHRFGGGTIGASEVARAEADRQATSAEIAALERDAAVNRAALAAAVGVPLAELEGTSLAIVAAVDCGAALSRDSLQQLALDERRSLRRALAEYQVAEADVRLQVAASWPDLQLGPGLFFDHGVGKWTIGFGLPSLPLHGNRGPTAEAEARREVAARRVAEAQEQVLGEVEQAVAGCGATSGELEALDLTGVRRRLALADSSYARGESGRLEVELASLELARSVRRLAEAQGRLGLARLALERATGVWGPTTAPGAGREGK
jgi:outer membrane protein TolC